jgi:hypothetical protein
LKLFEEALPKEYGSTGFPSVAILAKNAKPGGVKIVGAKNVRIAFR